MASHWMREVKFTESPTTMGRNSAAKFIYFFLRYVLGYTHVDQSVSSGRSFLTSEKSGSGTGSLVNSSYRFSDSANPFDSTDLHKWILIIDSVNPENCGWHQIVNFVDAGNIDINFKTAPGEYPTAATGLSWFIVGEDYDVPITTGDWWRLRTPHADAWEVELQLDVYGSYVVFRFRVSLDQDWTDAGKILGPTCGTPALSNNTNAYMVNWYVEGDSDGSRLHFLTLYLNGTTDTRTLCSIVPVTPWADVPAHSSEEKWAMLGAIPPNYKYNVNTIDRRNGAYNGTSDLQYWGNLCVWRNMGARQVYGGIVMMSKESPNESFTGLPYRQINSRRGRNDTMLGSPAIIDYDNKLDSYELMSVGGHESIRSNFTGMQVINQTGTRDKIHIGAGILLPWPGYTPTYTVG